MPEGKAEQGKSTELAVATRPKKRVIRPRGLPLFHVILLDDNDHTHEYVVEMLRALFGHSEQQGFRLAQEVDRSGRAVVLTTHKERAELKRDQIHTFGTDVRVATCCGSMSARIEPVEE